MAGDNYYDLRIKLWDRSDPNDYIAEYLAENVRFPNPINTGDVIQITKGKYHPLLALTTEPVKVFHLPEPAFKSIVYADILIGSRQNVPRLEDYIKNIVTI